jgi:hypothetical protein
LHGSSISLRYLLNSKEKRESSLETPHNHITPIEEIETIHLRLHRPTKADALILRNLWRNEQVRQFLGGIISEDAIEGKIASLHEHWDKYGFGQWSICEKETGQILVSVVSITLRKASKSHTCFSPRPGGEDEQQKQYRQASTTASAALDLNKSLPSHKWPIAAHVACLRKLACIISPHCGATTPRKTYTSSPTQSGSPKKSTETSSS